MQTKPVSITIFQKKTPSLKKEKDKVVVEKPLEIFINGKKFFLCLCLPTKKKELAIGLAFCENLISTKTDIKKIEIRKNKLYLQTTKTLKKENQEKYITSSSGSRDSSLDDFFPLKKNKCKKINSTDKISSASIFKIQKDFFSKQKIFPKTGGTHAAAIYNLQGKNLAFAEDVGRHNALDKCLGQVILKDKKGKALLVMLSSRLSFEMISKTAKLGAEIVLGVSAPTSLALQVAKQNQISLIGFLRESRFNIYSYPERIKI